MEGPTIKQVGYAGEGLYVFQCNRCQQTLNITWSLHSMTTADCGEVPAAFPLKHCWHCGVLFTRFEIPK